MISEAQLTTWTGLGSVQQSAATYATIKAVLEDRDAPYAARVGRVFLQGSYGNDTNVFGDSDVDIVIEQKGLWYYTLDEMTAQDQARYRQQYADPATYTLDDFRVAVNAWLLQNYAGDIDPAGRKAVKIRPRNNRRSADVVIAAPFRRYITYQNDPGTFVRGIQIHPFSGGYITNYPDLHSQRLTELHQASGGRLKPTIRIFKNMRNKLVNDGLLAKTDAPSYFIEGLLTNVPTPLFQNSHQGTVASVVEFVSSSDLSQFRTGSRQHLLIRDNEQSAWSAANFQAYWARICALCA